MITTTAPPRSAVPGRPPPYVSIEEPDPEEDGPETVEPTFTGIVVECDTEPFVSVMVTV